MQLSVINLIEETPDHISIIFEKPSSLEFYPGQYLDIHLPVTDERSPTRAFTIASAPTEETLRITFKKGRSPFKQYFQQIKPSTTITASHPAGTFTLDESAPAIFIAGGVGITPFRSIIKDRIDHDTQIPITLLYSNSNKHILFKKELDTWNHTYPFLDIQYIITQEQGRITPEQLKKAVNHQEYSPDNLIFYISGPPLMVNSFHSYLRNFGIDESNIRSDIFDGY